MKFINFSLGILMLIFVAVQYNDPDALWWVLVYWIPLTWSGLATFRLKQNLGNSSRSLLAASAATIFGLTVYYWPTTPDFWRIDVWWVTETAREGMGMMLASLSILVAGYTIWSTHKNRTDPPPADGSH